MKKTHTQREVEQPLEVRGIEWFTKTAMFLCILIHRCLLVEKQIYLNFETAIVLEISRFL